MSCASQRYRHSCFRKDCRSLRGYPALKKDKDIYYIFKIVQGVGIKPLVTELKEIFRFHSQKWHRTFIQNLQKAFQDEHSHGVGSVVGQLMQIPGDRDDRDILTMKVFATMDDFIQALISHV